MARTQIIFCSTDRVQLVPIKQTDNNSPKVIIHPKVNFKGLKFTPTPRRNTIEMEKDIHNFTRKLRLTEYFANENDITFDEEAQPLAKNKGTFHPPRNRNKTLDIVVDDLNNQSFDNAATKNKSNISKNEWEAIKSLKENDSIVIKEADKSGVVVVMNKTHYCSMVVKILQDKVTYNKTNEYCNKKVFKDLEKLVAKFNNCLLKEEQDFLTKFSFSTSDFYGLPMVHKSKIIQEAIQIQ